MFFAFRYRKTAIYGSLKMVSSDDIHKEQRQLSREQNQPESPRRKRKWTGIFHDVLNTPRRFQQRQREEDRNSRSLTSPTRRRVPQYTSRSPSQSSTSTDSTRSFLQPYRVTSPTPTPRLSRLIPKVFRHLSPQPSPKAVEQPAAQKTAHREHRDQEPFEREPLQSARAQQHQSSFDLPITPPPSEPVPRIPPPAGSKALSAQQIAQRTRRARERENKQQDQALSLARHHSPVGAPLTPASNPTPRQPLGMNTMQLSAKQIAQRARRARERLEKESSRLTSTSRQQHRSNQIPTPPPTGQLLSQNQLPSGTFAPASRSQSTQRRRAEATLDISVCFFSVLCVIS